MGDHGPLFGEGAPICQLIPDRSQCSKLEYCPSEPLLFLRSGSARFQYLQQWLWNPPGEQLRDAHSWCLAGWPAIAEQRAKPRAPECSNEPVPKPLRRASFGEY